MTFTFKSLPVSAMVSVCSFGAVPTAYFDLAGLGRHLDHRETELIPLTILGDSALNYWPIRFSSHMCVQSQGGPRQNVECSLF